MPVSGWAMQPPVAARVGTRGLGLLALGVIAYGLATLPLTWAVGLVATGIAGLAVLRWPWLIWCGLAVALPVSSGLKLGALSLSDVLLAAAVALWVADGVRRRSLRLPPAFLPLWIGGYALLLLGLSLRAPDLGEAITEVVKWAEVAVVVWLVGQTTTGRQKQWLVIALLLGGMLQALLGLYQFVFAVGPESFVLLGRFMRAAGSFNQPNPFAGYLGLTLPVAVSLALWSGHQSIARGVNSVERTIALGRLLFYTGGTVVLGLALVASWSRGAWLGAAMAVAAVVVFRSRRALAASLLGALLLAWLVLLVGAQPSWAPQPVVERLADLPAYLGLGATEVVRQPVTDANFAVIERLAHWLAAARMWERSPWFGVGPGNYGTVYPSVQLPGWDDPLGHAHNIYLNVLAETGLVGLLAYGLLWGGIVVTLMRSLAARSGPGWQHATIIGVLGVIVHLSVHNIVDNLYVQGIYLHIGLWLAAASVPQAGQTGSTAPGHHRVRGPTFRE